MPTAYLMLSVNAKVLIAMFAASLNQDMRWTQERKTEPNSN